VTEQEHKLRGNQRKVRAYIGIGSNEGDRVGFVQQCVQFLKDVPGIEVKESSSLYETEPMGVGYSVWFVNAVAAIDTSLSPEQLLVVCKEIEGRLLNFQGSQEHKPELKMETVVRGRRRIIDLDILFYGDAVLDSDKLRIPHPTVAQRSYALVPLLEIAPNFIHPRLQKSVTQIHDSLSRPEQVFLYGTRGADSQLG
jgi:2-amino-4-hydroxy-6-hydroxymethyldihydropteridine diphosphokinase